MKCDVCYVTGFVPTCLCLQQINVKTIGVCKITNNAIGTIFTVLITPDEGSSMYLVTMAVMLSR
jgi:hypothetical protein